MITKEQAILDEIVEQQKRAEYDFTQQVRNALARIKNASYDVKEAHRKLDECKKQLKDMQEPVEVDYKTLLAD